MCVCVYGFSCRDQHSSPSQQGAPVSRIQQLTAHTQWDATEAVLLAQILQELLHSHICYHDRKSRER